MTKQCEQCGVEFRRKPYIGNFKWQKTRFCSHGCASSAPRKLAAKTDTCHQCGAEFTTTGNGRYCSKCPTKQCERCGMTFKAPGSRNAQRFCSRDCAYPLRKVMPKRCEQCGAIMKKRLYSSAAQWNKKRFCSRQCHGLHQGGRVIRTCERCQLAYTVPASQSESRFCSKLCQFAALRGSNSSGWKGGSSSGRNEWIRNGGHAWKRAVRRRDAYTCQHCGIVKDSRSRGLHVHHKASFAEYPDLRSVVANGVCVCQACHNWLHSNEGALVRLRWEQDALAELGHLIVERDAAQEA